MTFANSQWWWALLLLPFLIAIFFRNEIQRTALLRKLVAIRLESQLAGNVSLSRRRLRFIVILLALALLIAGLAQPRWGYTWEKEKRHGRDVLIAIDCSRSMLANDLAPSRLARAKLAAEDLIDQLKGDRVGLIAFAGTAFLQAPLTFDHGAVLNALHELDTDIIPRGGTDIAEAIHTAVDAFGKGESDNRALVLFTDGEELEEDGVAAAREVKDEMRIFTVGLGSAEGTVIALPSKSGETEYVKDPDGQIVKSKLDEPRLHEIAESANGFYVHLLSGPPEMQQIVRDGLNPMTQNDLDTQFARHPIERFQWPVSAGLCLLAASLLIRERRKRWSPPAAAAALLFVFGLFCSSASAKNTGIEAYEDKDYQGAMDSFDRQLQRRPGLGALQFDLGAAAYKKGDYDKALENFSAAMTSADPVMRQRAEYNLANTLVQRGLSQKEKPVEIQELKNALQHYDGVLKSQPQHGDAKYNRDVVAKLLEELQKEPPKQQQQQQNDQQNKDQKNDQQKQQSQQNQQQQDKQQQQDQKQDQQPQQQQAQNQQSKDQQSKDQQSKDQQSKDQQSKDQQAKDQQAQNQQSQQQQAQNQQSQSQQTQAQNSQQQQGQSQDKQQKDAQQAQAQPAEKKDGQQGDEKQAQASNGEMKDGEKKDQQGDKKEDPEDKAQQAQQQQKQQEQAKPGDDQKKDQQQQQQQGQTPNQENPDHKLTGDVKDAGQNASESGKETPEQQAAEEAKAAAEGRMTENQARDLLDSLKSEDKRVRLLNPKDRKDNKDDTRPFRDW